jgi:hypothetical protein
MEDLQMLYILANMALPTPQHGTVSHAPAEVAVHALLYLPRSDRGGIFGVVGVVVIPRQEAVQGHDNPGGAETALASVAVRERPLDGMQATAITVAVAAVVMGAIVGGREYLLLLAFIKLFPLLFLFR